MAHGRCQGFLHAQQQGDDCQEPENCGSRSSSSGLMMSLSVVPIKVGTSGRLWRIYGRWYLVHMDSGTLSKIRPAAQDSPGEPGTEIGTGLWMRPPQAWIYSSGQHK